MPPEEIAKEVAKMETDAERSRRVETDLLSIRTRQHEMTNQINAIALSQTEKNGDIELVLHDIQNTLIGQNTVLGKLDHSVNGNGKKGLKDIVGEHDIIVRRFDKMFWSLLFVAIVGAAGIIAKLIIK